MLCVWLEQRERGGERGRVRERECVIERECKRERGEESGRGMRRENSRWRAGVMRGVHACRLVAHSRTHTHFSSHTDQCQQEITAEDVKK